MKKYICENVGEWSDELYNAGIDMVCNDNMQVEISEDDMERIKEEFPAAFDDIVIVDEYYC